VDFRYIEAVAIKWHDSGVNSTKDAQKYITQHEEKYSRYRLVLDFLGLKENELMKPQEEFLDKWFNTWSFSLELILEACKICSLRINEPNFNCIDGILSNWYKKGIKDIIADYIRTGEKDKYYTDNNAAASEDLKYSRLQLVVHNDINPNVHDYEGPCTHLRWINPKHIPNGSGDKKTDIHVACEDLLLQILSDITNTHKTMELKGLSNEKDENCGDWHFYDLDTSEFTIKHEKELLHPDLIKFPDPIIPDIY
jgi:DnaD/phage-associated family protein